MISPNRECSSFPIKIKIDKADVGLENVDNTADLDKPISNAVRDYLDGAKDSISTNVALAKEYADNAKARETNCETIEAKIEALNVATVDTAQNITGAKTFAGETTITGPLGVSGDTALSGKVTVEKELNVDSNGIATLNGKVTASNTGNSLKVANHDTVLTSNDVLSAKDINTPNGDANSLVHRNGDELSIAGIKGFFDLQHSYHASGDKRTWEWWGGEDSPSSLGYETIEEGDVDGEHGNIGYVRKNWTTGSDSYYSVIREFSGSNHYYRQIWVYKNNSIIYTNKFVDLSW